MCAIAHVSAPADVDRADWRAVGRIVLRLDPDPGPRRMRESHAETIGMLIACRSIEIGQLELRREE